MKSLVLGLAVVLTANTAIAQTNFATFLEGDGGITAIGATVTPVNFGAPTNGYTFDLFLDSAADILVIDATLSAARGQLYNDTNPSRATSDHAPGTPALKSISVCPPDLWITTPGGTSAADSSSLAAGETVTHFDTTDDGPQSEFHWASVILIPDEQGNALATLNAKFQTAASPTPLFNDVTVQMTIGVPEPNSFWPIGAALLGCAFVRRKRLKRCRN